MSDTLNVAAGHGGLRAAEWLARAQQDAAERHTRGALRRASGIDDEELLERLRRLGITPDTLAVLELAPPILVAWADGSMSRLERDRLRVLAVVRGVTEAHAAWPLVQHWMLQRPSAEGEQVLLAGLRARLERAPIRQRLKRRASILRDCETVARAAGRVLGGPKVSRDERDTLASIEARLGA